MILHVGMPGFPSLVGICGVLAGLCPLTVLRQQSRCVHLFDNVCVGWVDGVFVWVNLGRSC